MQDGLRRRIACRVSSTVFTISMNDDRASPAPRNNAPALFRDFQPKHQPTHSSDRAPRPSQKTQKNTRYGLQGQGDSHILRSLPPLMRCSHCGSLDDKVVDSRLSKDGGSIRRRRECLNCGHRFTTYEVIENASLSVVKRDGRREDFNREKLFRGLVKACEKRPVSINQLDQAVDEIMTELQTDGIREVPSQAIGARVMTMLRSIDPVAYVRYASVYRKFTAVEEFIDEIQSMEHLVAARRAEQQELFPRPARQPTTP